MLGIAVIGGILLHLIVPVRADASAGWLSTANPTLTKLTDLPSNVSPGLSNRDCTQETYNAINPTTGAISTATDCFADSTLGQMGLFGSPALFAGTSQGVQINSDYPYLVQPIPHQGMMLALSSAPVTGSYLNFYTDIRQHLSANYTITGILGSYTINHDPDFSLRDKNNAQIPTNAIGTLSYSSNGAWMLVDSPGGNFLRINMATFDVLPFAPSLNAPNDYANRQAATAISDDGHFAAIASYDYQYFRVYDLATCTGTTTNNYGQALNCQYRDYWPSLQSSLNGFRNIYSVRFTNDDNISLTAMYNWQSSTSFSVSKFTLTAPGRQLHGLDYLALGDSYISGEGEFQYKSGTDTDNNKCHQSPLSYPFIIGADLFNQYNSIACSGAKTKDINWEGSSNYNTDPRGAQAQGKSLSSYDQEIYTNFEPGFRTQLEFAKKYLPEKITLSVGGNDIGFAQIVQKCVVDYQVLHDCYGSYDSRMKLVRLIDQAYINFRDTYSAILSADPGAQLYVVGYPQVVAGSTCGLNVQLSSGDIAFAGQLINFLDTTIKQAADAVGARYVDVQDALEGHRLCEAAASSTAVNGITAGNDSGAFGLSFIGKESFHPNVLGHQLLAQAILSKTSNLKQGMPPANPTILAPTPNDDIAKAFLGNYPPPAGGTTVPTNVALANDVVGSSIVRGTMLSTSFDGSRFGLAPNTHYQFSMQTDGGAQVNLGSFTSDAVGNLKVSALLPAGTPVGYQTLSITGNNIAGQSTGIYADVYIAASATDLNGDGIADSQNQCLIIPPSGQDIDSDGIDDACDPLIGDVPKQTYPVTVRLTGNAIFVGN